MYCPHGYTLRLYCKHFSYFTRGVCDPDKDYETQPVEYTGEVGSEVRSKARKDGWTLHRDGSATCPLHSNGTLKKKRTWDLKGESSENFSTRR